MSSDASARRAPAPAVTRGAAVLDILAAQPNRAFSVSELSRLTQIPKSTTTNLCAALEDADFIRRGSGGIQLSYRLAQLGNAYLKSVAEIEEFYLLCRATYPRAAQTIQLGVLGDGLNVVFLARHSGTAPLNLGLASEIGRSVPAHCTATGKALLAASGVVETHLRSGGDQLVKVTPNSIGTLSMLDDELRATTARGYATELGEIVGSLRCFAAAVRTPHRSDGLIGISFSYPEHSVPGDTGLVGTELLEFASRFALRVGGHLA
ncbi:hypothetical protein GCM10027416_02310 [Okibacterium endophyticum]